MKIRGIIGGYFGYILLKKFGRHAMAPDYQDATSYEGLSKLEVLFGKDVWQEIRDKAVIDYGCGHGKEAIEIALRGARKVIGTDTWAQALVKANENARKAGVTDICEFTDLAKRQQNLEDPLAADVIFSLDAFEHYNNPKWILQHMRSLLKEGGRVRICFGPLWLHPYGGHLFSIFPWSHLLFTERAQIRWRSDFKTDGATQFHEVDGGLNQMTIHQFRTLVDDSDFTVEEFAPVPIRKLRWMHFPFTREFTTSVVRCTLVTK
ncbi:MAG: class I SAM-dependent methyltransferase [Gammaproteobacteria bacterium]|nr:class I SAM-dependent methyltransferase [Gammaproteobacteria bacterium]MDP2141410.1 class I SAM-dependent methyltransferase [Gammaproteobacteria bacterium]MDP2346426.1 class I SAM-dependent methyltransferase [Gammaproteobacteria bacterium]